MSSSISKINILIVHSSSDLYGSDKSLLDFVRYCGDDERITVVLPTSGALVAELISAGATVHVGNVGKIDRTMYSPLGIVQFFISVLRSIRFVDNIKQEEPFDIVYTNTLAAFGGAAYARLRRIPHVWHVREILSRSRLLTFGFRWLVSRLSTVVVCNSAQTRAWIEPKNGSVKYHVIWNGCDTAAGVTSDRGVIRARLGAGHDDVLFVLVGRINSWKGQKLLVQALSHLDVVTRRSVRLAIVGSAPDGQVHYEDDLVEFIAKLGFVDVIKVLPYRTDIDRIFDAADVVVVPSTEPEPFGRVAIEAMSFGKPVIAAAHGGLIEIVVDGATGMLVKPRSPQALANAIEVLARDPKMRHDMGEAGRTRHRNFFSVTSYGSALTHLLHTRVDSPKKTILFAHQSGEMYGSDKVLLWLAIGVKSRGWHPIVFIPFDGPLCAALKSSGVETHIVKITKLSRETLSLEGILTLPARLYLTVCETSRIVAGRKIDVVYSNTLAVLGSAVFARLKRIPHIWHVHELLMTPRVVRKGFPLALRIFADAVVCNSTMTQQWLLKEQPSLADKSVVVWNGLGPRPAVKALAANQLRTNLKIQDGQLLVALVGRINRWKGQELLLQTAAELWNRGIKHIHFLIVGGVAEGQEHLIDALRSRIDGAPAKSQIHIMEFTADIWTVWDACDIAVVPSTEPEPFGLVAIEAMASSKPVVVAAHGGLLDIVDDGVSGLLFKPSDAASFADQLQKLIVSPQLREALGIAGCARQRELFSLETQLNRTVEVLEKMTSRKHALNGK